MQRIAKRRPVIAAEAGVTRPAVLGQKWLQGEGATY
jgi:hypothetical protein